MIPQSATNIPDEIIELDESLKSPFLDRVFNSIQQWLDLYPATLSLRVGQSLDPEDPGIYIMENMYGTRMKIMENSSEWYDWKQEYGDKHHTRILSEQWNAVVKDMQGKTGVQLRPALAPHPKNLSTLNWISDNYDQRFKKTVLDFINVRTPSGLYECVETASGFTWKPNNQYIPEMPPQKFIDELKTRIEEENPLVAKMLSWKDDLTIGYTNLYPQKAWEPTPWTTLEPKILKYKKALVEQQADISVSQYMLFQQLPPLTRGANILLKPEQQWSREAPFYVGYITSTSSNPGPAIARELDERLHDAHEGYLSHWTFVNSEVNDELASYLYHLQAFALEKEFGTFVQQHLSKDVPQYSDNLMPKPINELVVGDLIYAGNSENPLNNPLWCRVTRIKDNVLTLFVENGHWDFQLDAQTNRSLDHEIISNFKGSVVIHSTDPSPFKHGSMYDQAINYYHQSFQVENGFSPR